MDGGSARRKVAAYTQDDLNAHRHPCLEWVKTVHALDRAAAVIGLQDKARYTWE
jgi:hypothetical protein